MFLAHKGVIRRTETEFIIFLFFSLYRAYFNFYFFFSFIKKFVGSTSEESFPYINVPPTPEEKSNKKDGKTVSGFQKTMIANFYDII